MLLPVVLPGQCEGSSALPGYAVFPLAVSHGSPRPAEAPSMTKGPYLTAPFLTLRTAADQLIVKRPCARSDRGETREGVRVP